MNQTSTVQNSYQGAKKLSKRRPVRVARRVRRRAKTSSITRSQGESSLKLVREKVGKFQLNPEK